MDNTVITDIKIPFWRAVVILVKWAIAAVPAAIILAVLYIGALALFARIMSGARF
jgi:hypothetical protein